MPLLARAQVFLNVYDVTNNWMSESSRTWITRVVRLQQQVQPCAVLPDLVAGRLTVWTVVRAELVGEGNGHGRDLPRSW